MVKQEKRNKEAAPIFGRYTGGRGSHHYPRQGIFEADLQCNCSLIQTTSPHPPERGSSFRYSLVALIHGKMERRYFLFHLLQDSPIRGSHI